MKHKKHRHGRCARSFEGHLARDRDVGNRKGVAWHFYDASRLFYNPLEPHFRRTSRGHALAEKHIRSVEESVRAPHGRLP